MFFIHNLDEGGRAKTPVKQNGDSDYCSSSLVRSRFARRKESLPLRSESGKAWIDNKYYPISLTNRKL